MHAAKVDGSDMERVQAAISRMQEEGVATCFLGCVASVLASEEACLGLLAKLSANSPFRGEELLKEKLMRMVDRLAQHTTGSAAFRMALKSAVQGIRKSSRLYDGPKVRQKTWAPLLRGVKLPREGQAAVAFKASQSAYPSGQELVKCDVGRLPGGRTVARGEVSSKRGKWSAIPLQLIVKVPEHIEVWSAARLRALLERTEKWFPREMEEHTLPCSTQGVRAVKELGGWALILRERYCKLVDGDADVDEWLKFLRRDFVNTITASSSSVMLCLFVQEERVEVDVGVTFGELGVTAIPITDHMYLSLQGYSLMPTHPARMAGKRFTVAQLRSMDGEGVDRDTTFAFGKACMHLLEERGLVLRGSDMTYGDLFSGRSLMGSVMWELAELFDMKFKYHFWADLSLRAQEGHRAAWMLREGIGLADVCDPANMERLSGVPKGGFFLFPPGGVHRYRWALPLTRSGRR